VNHNARQGAPVGKKEDQIPKLAGGSGAPTEVESGKCGASLQTPP